MTIAIPVILVLLVLTMGVYGIGYFIGVRLEQIRIKRDELGSAGDFKEICRSCFEKNYSNIWWGLNLHKDVCSVCKRSRVVDQVPTSQLQRKEK